MAKELCLDDFKNDYARLQEKHGLPGFEQMNEDFSIEKLAEVKTEYLVREVRKFVADKIGNYMRFVEALVQPSNVPMFVFSIVKSMGDEGQKKLKEIYKKIAKLEIDLIELDLVCAEEKEAQFIKEAYKIWQQIKAESLDVVELIRKNWDNNIKKDSKGYFG